MLYIKLEPIWVSDWTCMILSILKKLKYVFFETYNSFKTQLILSFMQILLLRIVGENQKTWIFVWGHYVHSSDVYIL